MSVTGTELRQLRARTGPRQAARPARPAATAPVPAGDPVTAGPVLLDAAPGGRLRDAGRQADRGDRRELRDPAGAVPDPATAARRSTPRWSTTPPASPTPPALRALCEFFHPLARALRPCGRVIVLGTPPEACRRPREATAQRALEGLTRSIGKEFGRGSTAQLVYVAPAPTGRDGTLTSLDRRCGSCCPAAPRTSPGRSSPSGRSVRPPRTTGTARWPAGSPWSPAPPGASARRSPGCWPGTARRSIALDVPAAGDELAEVANAVGGEARAARPDRADAPTRLAEHIAGRHGQVDVVVHNAGITRDKTLGRMDAAGGTPCWTSTCPARSGSTTYCWTGG